MPSSLLERKRQSWCSKNASKLRQNATKSELVFQRKLLDAGFFHFRFQKFFKAKSDIFFPDFWLKLEKRSFVAIEVDGDYHLTKAQQERDALKDKFYLAIRSCKAVLRVTDEIAFSITPEELKRVINGLKQGDVISLY